jgi:hypothetical protein
MRASNLASKVAGIAAVAAAGLVLLAGCGSGAAPHVTGMAPGANGEGTAGEGGGLPGATDGATPSPGASAGSGGSTGSGGGGGGGANASIKPCAMVTVQDASLALGTNANNTSDTEEECLYEAGDNAVMLSVRNEPYDAATVGELTQLGPAVKKIDGMGDAAYQISLGPETQFHVWTKGKYVVVVVTRDSGETAGPGRSLLDKVLAKI